MMDYEMKSAYKLKDDIYKEHTITSFNKDLFDKDTASDLVGLIVKYPIRPIKIQYS
jgi:hypothetical protein